MSTPKAVLDARARLREAEATVASLDATATELEQRRGAALDKATPARKRMDRVRVITKRPGDQYSLTTAATIAPYGYAPEGITDTETVAKYAKRLVEGNAKIVIHGGQGFSPKSLPMKVRTLSKADERLVMRANAARARARAALDAREAELTQTLTDVFGRSPKVSIDMVARDLAQIAHAGRQAALIRGAFSASNDRWRAERAVEAAKAHLAHAELRSKDPCPCSPCVNDRNAKQRSIEAAAKAKEDARTEAREAKRIAKLPRREFLCPTALAMVAQGSYYEDPHDADDNGESWVESPVDGKGKLRTVTCPDCDATYNLTAVQSRPVGQAPGQQQLIAA